MKIHDEPPPRTALLTAGRRIHEGRFADAIATLEGIDPLPSAVEPTRLRYLAIAHTHMGDPERALELLDRAADLAAGDGTADDRAWIASARANAHMAAGAPERAVGVLRDAVADLDQRAVADTVLRFRLLSALGHAQATQGDGAAALATLERSLELSDAFVDAGSRASRYAELADAEYRSGNAESADYYSRKSVYVREDMRMLEEIRTARAAAARLRAAR